MHRELRILDNRQPMIANFSMWKPNKNRIAYFCQVILKRLLYFDYEAIIIFDVLKIAVANYSH